MIPKEYDYVFLDCRAGYDILVSKIHSLSDFTICMQEDDFISDVTARNLIKQLERDNAKKPIFRIINKARNIARFQDASNNVEYSSYLGKIPFDMDVLNSFGEVNFWGEINKSLYRSIVAGLWNKVAVKMNLNHKLDDRRTSPVISIGLEKKLGVFMQTDRLILMIGAITAIMGSLYSLLGNNLTLYFRQNPDRLWSVCVSLFGILTVLSIYIKGNRR